MLYDLLKWLARRSRPCLVFRYAISMCYPKNKSEARAAHLPSQGDPLLLTVSLVHSAASQPIDSSRRSVLRRNHEGEERKCMSDFAVHTKEIQQNGHTNTCWNRRVCRDSPLGMLLLYPGLEKAPPLLFLSPPLRMVTSKPIASTSLSDRESSTSKNEQEHGNW